MAGSSTASPSSAAQQGTGDGSSRNRTTPPSDGGGFNDQDRARSGPRRSRSHTGKPLRKSETERVQGGSPRGSTSPWEQSNRIRAPQSRRIMSPESCQGLRDQRESSARRSKDPEGERRVPNGSKGESSESTRTSPRVTRSTQERER